MGVLFSVLRTAFQKQFKLLKFKNAANKKYLKCKIISLKNKGKKKHILIFETLGLSRLIHYSWGLSV